VHSSSVSPEFTERQGSRIESQTGLVSNHDSAADLLCDSVSALGVFICKMRIMRMSVPQND
jgi:hypothetical protein